MELRSETNGTKISLAKIADQAHRIYRQEICPQEKSPSYWTFFSYLSLRKTRASLRKIMEVKGLAWRVKIDPRLFLSSFEQAIQEKKDEIANRKVRPRVIIRRAHQIYCAVTPAALHPSPSTFTKRACGKNAWPKIQKLLKMNGVHSRPRVKPDRARVVDSFREAAEKLRSRFANEKIKPGHLANYAFRLYARGLADHEPRPSLHTFRRLIYGKGADPEILQLIGEKENVPGLKKGVLFSLELTM